jgi:hypothetical protein
MRREFVHLPKPMKRFLTLLLITACLPVGCVPIDPSLGGGSYGGSTYAPQPSYAPRPHYEPRYGHDGDKFGPQTHNKGYQCGLNDGRQGYSASAGRHRGEYNERYYSSFISGYEEGYRAGINEYNHSHAGHHHSGHSSGSSRYYGGPAEWYKSGKHLGNADRKAGRSCNYRRYSNHYDSKTREDFARGYEDGYDH